MNHIAAEVLSHYKAVGGDDAQCLAYLEKQADGAPDPTTASTDALRSAVLAQTALLRSVSEQQRLQYETYMGLLASFENRLMEAMSYFTARLDKLASWLEAIHNGMAVQSKPNQSLTSKKSKPAGARRKAKR